MGIEIDKVQRIIYLGSYQTRINLKWLINLILIIMLKKLLTNQQLYRFCFFDQQISDKYGKKCCRYGQDGKPMPEMQAT